MEVEASFVIVNQSHSQQPVRHLNGEVTLFTFCLPLIYFLEMRRDKVEIEKGNELHIEEAL